MFYGLDVLSLHRKLHFAISPVAELVHLSEAILQEIALLLKIILEFIAILIIAIALSIQPNSANRVCIQVHNGGQPIPPMFCPNSQNPS